MSILPSSFSIRAEQVSSRVDFRCSPWHAWRQRSCAARTRRGGYDRSSTGAAGNENLAGEETCIRVVQKPAEARSRRAFVDLTDLSYLIGTNPTWATIFCPPELSVKSTNCFASPLGSPFV